MTPDPSFVTLPDGRKLAWAEYGNAAGRPVLFFHGGPGSRLPLFPGQGDVDVRLICVERPGFGESSRHPERTLLGWADDVGAFADAIGLERFSVVGYSAGGPHALACAKRLEERLTCAVAVGCGAPADMKGMDWRRRILYFMARRAQWLLRLTYRSLPDPKKHPEKLVRKMLAGLPEPDRRLLERPEIFRAGVEQTIEGVKQGFEGMTDEVVLLARPWGFDLGSIKVPVTLWCGSEDTAAPVSMAEYLAANIPGARLRRIEGAGHLCIIEHWVKIMESTG
jgi:pimeloyl-ACP methyl ester carboxylesterase